MKFRKLALEQLEDRYVPSAAGVTLTVVNLNSSGSGSLAAAVSQNNLGIGGDTIDFETGLAGVISVPATLLIKHNLTIDGPGGGQIILDGTAGSAHPMLETTSNAITLNISGMAFEDATDRAIDASRAGTVNLTTDTFTDCYSHSFAGGYNTVDAVTTIAGCTFTDCTSLQFGGGAEEYGKGGYLTIIDSTFTGCSAKEDGGGAVEFYSDTDGTMVLQNDTFASDSALNGGAVSFYNNKPGGQATMTACTFDDCSAVQFGGAVKDYGASNSLTVTASTFAGCASQTNSGGAIYFQAGRSAGDLVLQSDTFTDNTAAGRGGAVYFYNVAAGATATIDGCQFEDNSATGDGGALWLRSATITINSCYFAGDRSGTGDHDSCDVYLIGSSTAPTTCTISNTTMEWVPYTSDSPQWATYTLTNVILTGR